MSTSVVWGFPNPQAILVDEALPKYVALLTQVGIGDPTVIVLQNTLGSDVLWSRNDQGQYLGTLTITLDANKTAIEITNSNFASNGLASANWISATEVGVFTTDNTGSFVDSQLGNNVFKITIYP